MWQRINNINQGVQHMNYLFYVDICRAILYKQMCSVNTHVRIILRRQFNVLKAETRFSILRRVRYSSILICSARIRKTYESEIPDRLDLTPLVRHLLRVVGHCMNCPEILAVAARALDIIM